jgi:NagD protein
MLAAIEASTGVTAEAVVGKPSAHMAAALMDRLALPADDTLLVGDRLLTDVRMAQEAGMHSALVLTGATGLDALTRSPVVPDYVLAGVADILPGGRAPAPAGTDPAPSPTPTPGDRP